MDGEFPSEKGDIFSAGVIFFRMLTGGMPSWKNNALAHTENFVLLTPPLQSLLRDMLRRDMDSRLGRFRDVQMRLMSLEAYDTAVAEIQAQEREEEAAALANVAPPPAPQAEPLPAPAQPSSNGWLVWTMVGIIAANILLLGGWLILSALRE